MAVFDMAECNIAVCDIAVFNMAVSFASSSVWNSIPNDVRCLSSLSSSKSRLKTYLFRSVYTD